ncbi:12484_t:CDS:2 [Cetraspora pellucida]|uniref:12484_t:CDS:1 n=1 Tax=Cetraspora pellucida TaxID=1433469 RepID=A0ACA9N2Y0_9GLOM|nr:12484_t:CDS:2 [Cetraspora pellucida]
MENEKKMPGSFPGQETPSKFKILPAHQFCYVREITKKKASEADLAFKELLKEINDESKELVFIPVKSKCFWHWDTLGGANWGHKVRQQNGWECGICVVGIMRRIREKYQGDMSNIELAKLGFSKEREELRAKYLKE